MKIISWDLETSSLNADYGIILCAGWKVVGEGKPKILTLRDYPEKRHPSDDRELCKDLADILLSGDCWLTWFGTYFDIPFLNSRLLYHRLPVLPANHCHIDGWKTAKYKLKLRNNRLITVQDFLGLPVEKNAIKGPTWVKAIAGDPKALRYVEGHCRRDVLVLEEAYQVLRPLITNHPSRLGGDTRSCPTCGSGKVQRKGYHRTRTQSYQRLHCQSCGAWSREKRADSVSALTLA